MKLYQPKDANSNVINGVGIGTTIDGDVSLQSIFTGTGVLVRIVITDAIVAATIAIADNDDTVIYTFTNFNRPVHIEIRELLSNGLKITTASNTGGQIRIVHLT